MDFQTLLDITLAAGYTNPTAACFQVSGFTRSATVCRTSAHLSLCWRRLVVRATAMLSHAFQTSPWPGLSQPSWRQHSSNTALHFSSAATARFPSFLLTKPHQPLLHQRLSKVIPKNKNYTQFKMLCESNCQYPRGSSTLKTLEEELEGIYFTVCLPGTNVHGLLHTTVLI